MLIFIRALSGGVTPVTVHPYEDVLSVKSRIFQIKGIAVSQQHLLYDGNELPDGTVLALANIGHGSLLRLVLKMHAAPLNSITANIPTTSTINQVNLGHQQPTSLCPIPIPAGHPACHWNSVVTMPHLGKEQYSQRKRGFLSLNPNLCAFSGPSGAEPDTSEEEVSQLAEFLGYAIDGGDVKSTSEEANNFNPGEQQSRLFSRECNTVPTEQIKISAHPVYHLVPFNGSLIPAVAYIQSPMHLRNNFIHTVPVSNADKDPRQTSAEGNQDGTTRCTDGMGPTRVDAMADESCLHDYSEWKESNFIEARVNPWCARMGNVQGESSSTTMIRPTLTLKFPAKDLTHYPQCDHTDLTSIEIPTAEVVVPALSRVQVHPYLLLNGHNNSSVTTASQNSLARTIHGKEHSTSVHTSLLWPKKLPYCSQKTLNNDRVDQLPSSSSSSEKCCSACHKRTTLTTGFSCWCDRWFCIKHYHPEDHNCDFNFKATRTKSPTTEF
ncbi:hypothetical protein CRM22_001981 [Opisthorchis felineus]|uniref:Ubiquitin-like domain-containing protein n=1 Tax=Opisthorchis felineus TaxID=147828 RepID=A0A4S2M862_OPIFE|nr:hypothetical protein CRM22_001981 [Opisthorchis felineus]